MDYEREPGSDLGQPDGEPSTEAEKTEPTDVDAPTELASGDYAPAEPASGDDAPLAQSSAYGQTYDELGDELTGGDDDSDAPVQLDEEPPIDAPVNGTAGPAAYVRAENVTLTQGGAQKIDATTVSLSQGGAGQVRAEEMTVHQGAVGVARTGSLTVQSEASAFAVVADKATVEDGASVFLLISRSLNGEVRPTIDWRSALAFGAGIGLVLSVLRRIR